MIAFVKGRLYHKEATYAVIDVNGVGYHVSISLNTFSKIKDEEQCMLFTHMHVREDIQALYGFHTEEEKDIFKILISISGIGPNTALVILSTLTPYEIQSAIVNEDVATIQGVKGIGAKTAQRVIIELKDKMKKLQLEAAADGGNLLTVPKSNTLVNEALTALVTLGIQKSSAEKTINAIIKKHGSELSLEEVIKLALKRS